MRLGTTTAVVLLLVAMLGAAFLQLVVLVD